MMSVKSKEPDWKIRPAKDVCHRNSKSASVRLRHLGNGRNQDQTKIVNGGEDTAAGRCGLSDLADQSMDELRVVRDLERANVRKAGTPQQKNHLAFKLNTGEIDTQPFFLKSEHRRPSTSPCQTANNLFTIMKSQPGNGVEINSVKYSPSTRYGQSITNARIELPIDFKKTGIPEPASGGAPAVVLSGESPRRTSVSRVTSGATLQVPARREGTPKERRRPEPGEEGGGAEASTVFFLNPEVGAQRCIVVMTEEDSDEYDTDCEPEIAPDFRPAEYHECQARLDADIGHLTYEVACKENDVKPRRRVLQQLWEEKLDLPHAGLATPEVKAIAAALAVNSRVETLVMSDSHLVSEALSAVFKSLIQNCFLTELNLSGSFMDMSSATVCGDMLTNNRWLLSLNLSNCCIGDNETGPISQGIKENSRLENLNLSKNKISVSGGLLLGRVLGQNNSLKIVNLSWNHIRGGGAVGVCNSLQSNKSIEDYDLSWNGIGFEGCLALGESLRVNKTLKRLNLENNRVNWDCAPYLSKSLSFNTSLETLEVGLNPMSMEGCEDILTAICKPSSKVQYISFAGIPINTKIAFLATDIAKLRPFNLIHGGIFSSKDVLGIQRVQQEDPFSLLVRYMSTVGIRVVDLFRIFDKDNKLCVSRERFIQGLKRVRVPLDDSELLTVAKRLQLNKRGTISYQELATLVRNRMREDRIEDKRQEMVQRKKREERKRILQSDKPLNAPSHYNFMPGLYNMYSNRERDRSLLFSPTSASLSRPGSIYTPLPPIRSDRNYASDELSYGRKSPVTLVRQNALRKGTPIKSTAKMMDYPNFGKQDPEGLQKTSYVSQVKWHHATQELLKRRQSFL